MTVPFYDAVIIGAGASGLMAAARAGALGKKVLLLDHGAQVGARVLISGGGRCNFTNLFCGLGRYVSANPRFCLSALKGFGPQDFAALVRAQGIAFHEKEEGQLFCDGSARQIVQMLLDMCAAGGVEIRLREAVTDCGKEEGRFYVQTRAGRIESAALVLATGGLAVPKMGASPFALDMAARFGLPVIEPRPALVPLTFKGDKLLLMRQLSGLSLNVIASCGRTSFSGAMLFTHRGLSGPAILQISSYWREGQKIAVNLSPACDAAAFLLEAKRVRPRAHLRTVLSELIPARLAYAIALGEGEGGLADLPDKILRACGQKLNKWELEPDGTEGFAKAEAMLGGLDTRAFSSKTMACQSVPNLYATGEALDVTGWLGGYNLQWAWSSGYAAGSAIGRAGGK